MMIHYENVSKTDCSDVYRVTDSNGDHLGVILYHEDIGYLIYDATDTRRAVLNTKAEVGRYFRELVRELS